MVAAAAFLAPAFAFACPAARDACATSCSGTAGYVAALGVGLLAGIGSVKLEGLLKRK